MNKKLLVFAIVCAMNVAIQLNAMNPQPEPDGLDDMPFLDLGVALLDLNQGQLGNNQEQQGNSIEISGSIDGA